MGTIINVSEEEYRNIRMDSSSSLKEFSIDRRKYRKRYIFGEKVEEKDNQAANMGRIVETLLLEPQEFDNRFYMSSLLKTPTGLMLDFVEALYKYTREATDEEGIVQVDFSDVVDKAYKESGFKITKQAVLSKFDNSDAQIYYEEIRMIRPKNLTVVTTQDITNAEKIVEELKTNFVTASIVNLVNSDRYEILDQLKIIGFTIKGRVFKSMLDKVIVDHQEKTITPYDLKCVWNVEGFYEDYYLYRRAYIQAYVYYKAILSLTLKEDSPYFGYKVAFLQFIICDSINYFNPLIYTLDTSDMNDSLHGFEYKGRRYPGVKKIIDDLNWATETDTWHISKENFEKKGVINIKE